MFLFEDAFRQRFRRVFVEHRHHGLLHDRTGIEPLIHEVHGAAGELYTMLDSLELRVQTRESRQQGWMDIENAMRVFADEMAAENAHEPGQAYQVHAVPAKFVDKTAIIDFAVEVAGREAQQRAGRVLWPKPGRAHPRDSKLLLAISAFKRPASMESAMARKFEPRPEIRIPRRFIARRSFAGAFIYT